MVAPRSSPLPAALASQPTSCQCPASPTRKRLIFTSTTSMPTTAASRNGCAPSMASRRRTCPTTLAGAALLRRWAKRSCPRILYLEQSDSDHINTHRHYSDDENPALQRASGNLAAWRNPQPVLSDERVAQG